MKTFYNPLRPYRSTRFVQTRETLRNIARANSIPRGRNTDDTVRNLRTAGITVS